MSLISKPSLLVPIMIILTLLVGFTAVVAANGDVTVTVKLLDSNNNGIQGGEVKYYSGGWQTFGTTNINGEIQKVLPSGSYKFKMTYAGASQDKTQDIGIDSTVIFQTVLVTVELRDSTNALIDTGSVQYYASGWKTFGDTSGGQVTKELLPLSYQFQMSYVGGSQKKTENVGTTSTITFQTVLVTVELRDSTNALIDTGSVKYYASGWKTFGDTSGGQVTKELLPLSYQFQMSYVGGSQKKTENVGTTSTITFQTGQVHSVSGAATQYYASGWKIFTNDMELLPGSYKFKFSDGTSDTTYPITAGIVNNIH